jgi:hypothetical protein
VWRAFGGGSGLAQVIGFVNCSEYKTPPCELQDLRRRKRYSASRIGETLKKVGAALSASATFLALRAAS